MKIAETLGNSTHQNTVGYLTVPYFWQTFTSKRFTALVDQTECRKSVWGLDRLQIDSQSLDTGPVALEEAWENFSLETS